VGFFFMGGYRFCRAMTVALVRPLVRVQEVGLAFGIVESINAFAMMVAPVLAGFLYNWRPVSIFPVGVGLVGLTLLVSLRFMRRDAGHLEDQHFERIFKAEG